MKWDRQVFLSNVDQLINERCGGLQREFNSAICCDNAVAQWVDGVSPTIDSVVRICELLDCEVSWLLNGQVDGGNRGFINASAFIPKYKASLSGREGSCETSDDIVANFVFIEEWVRSKGDPKNLALFDVHGDSMMPVINDGDVVMVDRSLDGSDGVQNNKIYAFRENDTIKVKRFELQAGGIRIISDNSAVSSEYMADMSNFQIIGKVVWVGHDLE